MNKIYQINDFFLGEDKSVEESVRYYKGETEIVMDFSDFIGSDYDVIKISIDFNDGTSNHTVEYDYSNSTKILTDLVTHKYYPSETTDNIFYYPTIFMTFSNFKRYIVQLPLRITKESFYSKYNKIDISSAQFIDDVENSMLITFRTINGDILNSKIK